MKIGNLRGFLWPKNREVAETFEAELQVMARPYFFFISILCCWVWLPYIEIDRELHPRAELIEPLRWGFSIVSFTLLLLFVVSKAFRNKAEWLLRVLFLYLGLSVSFLTAGSEAHANYLAGYFLCLLCTSTLPLTFSALLVILNSSFLVYGVTCFVLEVDFSPTDKAYGLQDTFSVYLVTHIFGYALHRLRSSLHSQALRLREQGRELEESLEERTRQLDQSYQDLRSSLADKRKREVELEVTGKLLDKVLGEGEERIEEERKELADQLHDSVKQSLAVSKLKVEQLASMEGPEELKEALRSVSQNLKEAIDETRSMVQGMSLRILEEFGLSPALEELHRELKDRHGVDMVIREKGSTDDINGELARHLYRSVQELSNNVVKHAGVETFEVGLEVQGGKVLLEVRDEGCGFVPQRESAVGYGLYRIQQRCEGLGGDWELISQPGQGCQVQMKIPLEVKP